MHSVSHSISHRGPGASRARARWQPYAAAISSAASTSRSPAVYLNTPASSTSSTPPATTILSSICTPDRPRRSQFNFTNSQTLPPTQGQLREAQKNRYVSGLVDQAVRSLCDIWQPDDIPIVFRTSTRTAFSASTSSEHSIFPNDPSALINATHFHIRRNNQLPSPISPSTILMSGSSSPEVYSTFSSQDGSTGTSQGRQPPPIKGFVHEVLRRSRTSAGVLQTALCYLEAIRSKVPDLLKREQRRASEGIDTEQPSQSRIVLGTLDDILEAGGPATNEQSHSSELVPTIRIDPDDGPLTAPPSPLTSAPYTRPLLDACASVLIPPSPSLPSPLLCPRRTFLACLILASKFMQDRSYSNRAWAKLAGLQPREIGRCERALGEILEWRLWVGKGPSTGIAGGFGQRPVVRSRSEADLSMAGLSSSSPQHPPAAMASGHRKVSSLRRSATAPSLGTDVPQALEPFPPPSQEPIFPSAGFVEEPEVHSSGLPQLVGDSFTPSYTSLPRILELSQGALSPMPTPPLTYSPISTASCSSDDGDRTIQLESFVDTQSAISYTPLPIGPSKTSDQDHFGFSFAHLGGSGMLMDTRRVPDSSYLPFSSSGDGFPQYWMPTVSG